VARGDSWKDGLKRKWDPQNGEIFETDKENKENCEKANVMKEESCFDLINIDYAMRHLRTCLGRQKCH
jgi:hypothetical protein